MDSSAHPFSTPVTLASDEKLTGQSQKHQLLAAVLENVQAGVVACDADGFLTLFNKTARDFHELPQERLPAERWAEHYDLYHGDGVTRMKTEEIPLFRALKEGLVQDAEMVIAPKSGASVRHLFASGRAMYDERGTLMGAVVAMHDVTSLKRKQAESETWFRFLSELGDATRAMTDPEQVMAAVAEKLGRHLECSRCAYADVSVDSNHFVILDDYTAEGQVSSAGDYDLSLFGPRAAADMRSGRTLVIHDVKGELAPNEGAEMFTAIGIQALVCCPLIKEGRLVAMMAVHQAVPRAWKPNEVGLVEAVVERSWAYVERVRSMRAVERAASAEREQRQLLEAITNNAAASLFITDELQRVVFMNPAAEQLTGFTLPEMRNRPLHEAMHHSRPDGTPYPRKECPIDRSFNEDFRRDGEEVFIHKDGSFYPAAFTASPIRGGAAHAGTIVEIRDLREQKAAEEGLRRSEERYRFLAESIPQMVWTATPDGALDYVNQRVSEYFGVTREEVLGAGWLNWVHSEDKAAVVQQWTQSLESGQVYESQFRLLRSREMAREWRWHLVRAVPFRSTEGAIALWFGTCTDIEEQRRAESLRARHLEREQAALRRHNEDLQQFAFAAAHDLQEPLRTVHSYTQLLERSLSKKLSDEERQFMSYVTDSSRRMTKLVQDLRSFIDVSGNDEGEKEEAVNLKEVFENTVSNLQSAIVESGAVVTSGDLPSVLGSEVHFLQLLQNLISNAMKYRREEEPPRIHVSAKRAGKDFVVSVKDNGQGIPEHYQELVFGLFKRLHGKSVPGTGIGLALCRRIVERAGGRIWVESDGKQESTFYFRVKASEQ